MRIGKKHLELAFTPLMGFVDDKVILERSITLSVTANDPLRQSIMIVKFLVVNFLSIYNAILGKRSLNAVKAIISTYHLVMKFPTCKGV